MVLLIAIGAIFLVWVAFSASKRESSGNIRGEPLQGRSSQDRGRIRVIGNRSFKVPTVADHNLRIFYVSNPEGEIFLINTADPTSPYYGPAWTAILSSLTEKYNYVRGRVYKRMTGRRGNFTGYTVIVGGIEGFLPRRLAGDFADETIDATGLCIMLKTYELNPAVRKEWLIWDAVSPYREIIRASASREEIRRGNAVRALTFYPDPGARALIVKLPRDFYGVIPFDQINLALEDLEWRCGLFIDVEIVSDPWEMARNGKTYRFVKCEVISGLYL